MTERMKTSNAESLKILGAETTNVSLDALTVAFQRQALHAHQDRGGSRKAFIKVVAAFRAELMILYSSRNSAETGVKVENQPCMCECTKRTPGNGCDQALPDEVTTASGNKADRRPCTICIGDVGGDALAGDTTSCHTSSEPCSKVGKFPFCGDSCRKANTCTSEVGRSPDRKNRIGEDRCCRTSAAKDTCFQSGVRINKSSAQAALLHLHAVLQGLTLAKRKLALESLPKRVRFALLLFMEDRKNKPSRKEPLSSKRQYDAQLLGSNGPLNKKASNRKTVSVMLERNAASPRLNGKRPPLRYRVRELFQGLDLRTQYFYDLETAIRMMAVLARAFTEARSSAYGACDHPLAASVAALARMPSNTDGSTRKSDSDTRLKLSFRASVNYLGCRIEGGYTTDLKSALRHRRMLLAARSRGWRAVHATVLQLRRKPTRRRTRTLREDEAGRLVGNARDTALFGLVPRVARTVEKRLTRTVRTGSSTIFGLGPKKCPRTT